MALADLESHRRTKRKILHYGLECASHMTKAHAQLTRKIMGRYVGRSTRLGGGGEGGKGGPVREEERTRKREFDGSCRKGYSGAKCVSHRPHIMAPL